MAQRSWCFTSFKVDEFAFPQAYETMIKYLVWQEERCPHTGKEHIQGYVELNRPQRMSWLKIAFNDNAMHIEKRKGSRKQARDYCMKTDSRQAGPWEVGTWREDREGQGKRNDLVAVYDKVKEGATSSAVAHEFPAEFIRYHNGIKALKFTIDAMKWSRAIRQKLRVVVYYGATGTGKTRRAIERNEDYYKLDRGASGDSVWWDGYEGQRTLIIDDFYGWVKWGFFLNMLDIYPLRLAVKGTHTYAAWERVIITSNEPPEKWYKKQLDQSALMRRLHKVVEFKVSLMTGDIVRHVEKDTKANV